MMKMVIRFLLLSVAYLAFAGQISTDECVAAVLSAGAIIGLGLYARSWQTQQFSFQPAVVLRLVLSAVPKLLTDSLKLIPHILANRWQTGEMSQQFIPNAGVPRDLSWWAVFTLTASASPNTILITRLARPGEVAMHRLVRQPTP